MWLYTLRGLVYHHSTTHSKSDKLDKSDKSDKPDKSDKSDKSGKLDKLVKLVKSDKTKYPSFLLSPSFEEATLTAQLASWTELRHDTVLYTKQSAMCMTLCDYPTGYVDPRIEFWTRFIDLVDKLKTLIGELTFSSTPVTESRWGFSVPMTSYKTNQIKFLSSFLSTLTTLRDISRCELESKELNPEHLEFLKQTVSRRVTHGSGAGTYYNGWYFGLFYKVEPEAVIKGEPLVTDIQTDSPSDEHGDPGSILHVATGNVPLSFIYVKNGKDEMVFSGPVYTFHEFDMPFGKRMTDEEWTKVKRKKEVL